MASYAPLVSYVFHLVSSTRDAEEVNALTSRQILSYSRNTLHDEARHAMQSNRWFYYFSFSYRFFFTEKSAAAEACASMRTQT